MSSKSRISNIIKLAKEQSKSNKDLNPNSIPNQLSFNEIIATASFEYYNDTNSERHPSTINKFQEVLHKCNSAVHNILSKNLISNDVDTTMVNSEVPKYFYIF